MAKKAKNTIITIAEYAIKCGVSEQRIYQRISEKLITPVFIKSKGAKKGTMFIDLATTPILEERRGRKSAATILKEAGGGTA